MELGGRDLVRVLERQGGPLPLDEALYVGLALCRALEYAHGHGVIHRDLNPPISSSDRPTIPLALR